MRSKAKLKWVILLLLVEVLAGLWWWRGSIKPRGENENENEVLLPPMAGPPVPPRKVRTGDAILHDYAQEGGSVQGDLRALAEVIGNFALLVKGPDPLPLGANEELAAALLGKNKAELAFVSAGSAALNERGQLVDRWGTPLFFHARARDRVDIRSAGPDGKMWTEDDVHRIHDGQYLRGAALNAPSLFEAGNASQ
jgi:hypothetical protein